MIKSYVIDTNVLIQAPYACQCFEENRVILPLVVLEELDGLKKAEGEKGANARRAIRCVGVELPESLPEDKADKRILKVCKGISDEEKPVVLVTKDLVLRIKAQIMGIEAQDFSTEQVIAEEEQYSGRQQCFVAEDKFKDFKKKGVPVKELYLSDEMGNKIQPELVENEFIILKADQSLKKTHLGRVEGKKVVPLKYKKNLPYGVKPRNSGQYFLQEALMKPADEAPLVIVKGMAGTAKTFYSLAVGLEKILNNPTGEYRRILICRPNAQFDSDIGFLPGDEQEKISPLMRPIMDNLEQLIDSDEEARYQDEQELQGKIEEIFARGIIQAEAMNFIRGRSFVNTYLIIDEAQNMTPNQVKGIITRAGKGTKIVLLGDPNQIDRPFLDERTNGLSYASEYMKGSPLCYQITMSTEECERSELAMDAIRRL